MHNHIHVLYSCQSRHMLRHEDPWPATPAMPGWPSHRGTHQEVRGDVQFRPLDVTVAFWRKNIDRIGEGKLLKKKQDVVQIAPSVVWCGFHPWCQGQNRSVVGKTRPKSWAANLYSWVSSPLLSICMSTIHPIVNTWRCPKMEVPLNHPCSSDFPLWTIQLLGYHQLWNPLNIVGNQLS